VAENAKASAAGRLRVVFLVRSLEVGGAERQLAGLARGLDRARFAVTVCCFYDAGRFAEELRSAGVGIVPLEKRGRWDGPRFFRRLAAEMRALRPHVVHSFLGPPNVAAAFVKPRLPGVRLVWGVRASNMELGRYDYSWRLTSALERFLSRRADVIAANSFAGRDHVVGMGYPPDRVVVVPNGIDVGRWRPDERGGRAVRAAWGVAPDEALIGLVARLDPMKDHETFLRAAALAAAGRPGLRFVCVGAGGGRDRDRLARLAAELGIADRVVWAGPRDDMAAVYSALDVHTSSSAYGEGFSNAVAEAMAAGVPCAVTDVGDSARIVGDTGPVVPPGDPAALADGWRRLLDLGRAERRRLGERCRRRIADTYSEARMIERMAAIYAGARDGTGGPETAPCAE